MVGSLHPLAALPYTTTSGGLRAPWGGGAGGPGHSRGLEPLEGLPANLAGGCGDGMDSSGWVGRSHPCPSASPPRQHAEAEEACASCWLCVLLHGIQTPCAGVRGIQPPPRSPSLQLWALVGQQLLSSCRIAMPFPGGSRVPWGGGAREPRAYTPGMFLPGALRRGPSRTWPGGCNHGMDSRGWVRRSHPCPSACPPTLAHQG